MLLCDTTCTSTQKWQFYCIIYLLAYLMCALRNAISTLKNGSTNDMCETSISEWMNAIDNGIYLLSISATEITIHLFNWNALGVLVFFFTFAEAEFRSFHFVRSKYSFLVMRVNNWQKSGRKRSPLSRINMNMWSN